MGVCQMKVLYGIVPRIGQYLMPMSDSDQDSDQDTCDRHVRPAHGCTITFHVAFAALIRLTLLFYGVFHDQVFHVKYTDVDYMVFTDGARFVSQGRSPFLRDGYRYTPLIAFLLVPNVIVSLYGKLLFLLFDLFTGSLIYRILKRMEKTVPCPVALLSALTWFYNPLPLVISTRGSGDSIQTFLVLAVIACLQDQRTIAAGLLYGLSVHFKLYPVIYGPAIYLLLSREVPDGRLASSHLWNPFTRKRLSFFMAAAIAFCATTALSCHWYEERYVREAWVYHFRRIDMQHNFSVYFYLYHLIPRDYHSVLSSFAFLLQLIAVVVVSVVSMTSASSSREQVFAKFLVSAFHSTFLFVSLNKVITSQYFLWYLCLLPFVLPFLPHMWTTDQPDATAPGANRDWFSFKFLLTAVLWIGGQVVWLLPAYLYEFMRWQKSLVYVWLASILFLAVNLITVATLWPRFPAVRDKKGS